MPQQAYANVQTPISSPLNQPVRASDWDAPGHVTGQQFSSGGTTKRLDHDNSGGTSPFNRYT